MIVAAMTATMAATMAAALAVSGPATAQAVADFYRGKILNIYVGSAEGGSLDAYRAFISGWLRLETLDVRELPGAIDDFRQAIAADHRYALAHTGLASAQFASYETTRSDNVPARELLDEAIDHARHAVALDDNLAEAHAALGFVLTSRWETEEAVAAARRAVFEHHIDATGAKGVTGATGPTGPSITGATGASGATGELGTDSYRAHEPLADRRPSPRTTDGCRRTRACPLFPLRSALRHRAGILRGTRCLSCTRFWRRGAP